MLFLCLYNQQLKWVIILLPLETSNTEKVGFPNLTLKLFVSVLNSSINILPSETQLSQLTTNQTLSKALVVSNSNGSWSPALQSCTDYWRL